MQSPGAAHLGRAMSSALVVVLLSLAFHLLGGGAVPDLLTVGWLGALTTAAAAPLARRQVRLPGLLALLGLAQVALHLGFEAGAGHGAHGAPLPMVATHAIATALTALVLVHGRSLLRRALARRARRRLLPPRAVPGLPRITVLASRPVLTPAPGTGAVMGRAPPSRFAVS